MKKVTKAEELSLLDVVKSPAFVYVNNMVFRRTTGGFDHILMISHEECPDTEGYNDETRGEALFVITGLPVEKGDGCTSYGPDFPYFTARRLNADGSFDPKGEEILFALGKHYGDITEVTVVGKMQLVAA